AGTRLLDVGCGSGVAAALALERGVEVNGLDATPELLAFARKRAPGAEFRHGEMEALPYPDDAFDVITGFNSFQYAADPVNALRASGRVSDELRLGSGGARRHGAGHARPRLAAAPAAARRAGAVRALGGWRAGRARSPGGPPATPRRPLRRPLAAAGEPRHNA